MERKTADIYDDRAGKVRQRSGFAYSWKLWRHCCCRYGKYPLVVAPIITCACLMSLYASAGCDFVRVTVGFSPSNEAWNETTAELGLFFYQSGEPETNKYREALLDGCRWYDDDFDDSFIDGDRTWKVARVMAYISGGASIVATVSNGEDPEWEEKQHYKRYLLMLSVCLTMFPSAGDVMDVRLHTPSCILFLASSFASFVNGRISRRRLKVSIF